MCYFYYQKSILNDDSFKEYINTVFFYQFKVHTIIKKVYLFALVAVKIYAYNKSNLLFQLVTMNICQKQSLNDVP